MKRILAMILALVLCLGLCACGEEKNDHTQTYVGGWTNGEDEFILMKNGKALLDYSSLEDAANEEITDMSAYASAGTWNVDGEYLIIYFEDWSSGEDIAQVFKIEDSSTLSGGGTVYTKR